MSEVDPVPFTLKVLTNLGHDVECGACMEIGFTGVTFAEHSCRDATLTAEVERLQSNAAFSKEAGIPHQRVWDLLRQMRGELSEANLISGEEYAWLAFRQYDKGWEKPGQGSPAPRRLETYDDHESRRREAEAEVERLQKERDRIRKLFEESSTDEERKLRADVERLRHENEALRIERDAAQMAYRQMSERLLACQVLLPVCPTCKGARGGETSMGGPEWTCNTCEGTGVVSVETQRQALQDLAEAVTVTLDHDFRRTSIETLRTVLKKAGAALQPGTRP